MSAAGFVLAINLFVAFIFATAFGVIAANARSAVSARWLALAYGFGMLNPILEFVLPSQQDPRPVQVAIVMVFQIAIGLGVVGLARHYRLVPPLYVLSGLLVATLLLNILIIDMPRESMLRAVLYQLPYFLVHLVAVITILRYRHRRALDRALLIVFSVSALQFLAKPLLAGALGSGGSARGYIHSTYAAISQTLGGMLLLATGLLLLLIIARDAMAEMTARSETDKLSGLLNRRGFEDRADRLLTASLRSGTAATMVVADLDHFKAVNDSYGHEAGDSVISTFAGLLTGAADQHAVIGRLGGEEFAVFVPRADLEATRVFAENVRSDFSSLSIANLGPHRRVSASFGVAELGAGDSLSDLLRRADAALYEAKKGGRNRVCVASTPAPIEPQGGERRQGSRRTGS